MRVFSYTQNDGQIQKVEVEISLISGLPQVHFTGMADATIKESILRVKSAIRNQGFEWPKTKQMIINLRPAWLKKSSKGLDLAIACALLWKTKQVSTPQGMNSPYHVYGELSLEGLVSVPTDWESLPSSKGGILTGEVFQTNYFSPLFQVSELKGLEKPNLVVEKPISDIFEPPKWKNLNFSENQALLLKVCALGEHSLLLAGEAGSGKSTLSEQILPLLAPPKPEDFKSSYKIWSRFCSEPLKWRPFVSPHHSTPALSMIGGGYPLFCGEICKAHGGILFMDEYLEFSVKVQEALREPMESGCMRVVRKGVSEVFPSKFMLVAATNLCPCGDLVPGQAGRCSYSLRKCFSHLHRLNGPMLDRFDILAFSSWWKGELKCSMESINKDVKKAREFQKNEFNRTTVNGKLSLDELEKLIDSSNINQHMLASYISSKRRKRAILRVARTLADLEQKIHIEPHHIAESKELAFAPFLKIKNLGDFP